MNKETIRFDSSAIKIYNPSEDDLNVAKASYDNLKAFLPDIDFDKNYDVLGISFSSYVASYANRNFQVIDGLSAKKIAPLFLQKPINKDHNRKEVIGVITNYGFSEFGTERPLTEEEVDELIANEQPFNVNLGGILWRVCDPEYIENIVAVNNSNTDKKYATSWEVGFGEFKIAQGSPKLADAKIITNPDEILAIKEKLRHFGGKGKHEGQDIFLFLQGGDENLISLGVGITKNPAGHVGPLFTSESEIDDVVKADDDMEEDDDKDENKNHPEDCDCEDCLEEKENDDSDDNHDDSETYANSYEPDNISAEEHLKLALAEKNKNNSSLLKPACVSEETGNSSEQTNTKILRKYMVIKNIKDITNDVLKQVDASVIQDFIEVSLKQANDQYVLDKQNIENEKQRVSAELNNKLQAIEDELTQLKAENEAREKAEAFNARLEGIKEEFELNEEELELVASQIKNAPDFQEWYKGFSVFAKGKNKAFMKENAEKEKNKEKEDKEAKAHEALANLKPDDEQQVPPNAQAPAVSTKEKWAKLFNNDSISISKK